MYYLFHSKLVFQLKSTEPGCTGWLVNEYPKIISHIWSLESINVKQLHTTAMVEMFYFIEFVNKRIYFYISDQKHILNEVKNVIRWGKNVTILNRFIQIIQKLHPGNKTTFQINNADPDLLW